MWQRDGINKLNYTHFLIKWEGEQRNEKEKATYIEEKKKKKRCLTTSVSVPSIVFFPAHVVASFIQPH